MAEASPVYIIRSSDDVGIGNGTFFSTEQHPKKHTDTFGILTLQTTKFNSYADAQNGHNPKNVIVRCTKYTPTLRAVLAKTMAWVTPYKTELRDFINQHVHRSYAGNRGRGQGGHGAPVATTTTTTKRYCEAKVLQTLSDALYVFEVKVCATEQESEAPWRMHFDTPLLSSKDEKIKKRKLQESSAAEALGKYMRHDTPRDKGCVAHPLPAKGEHQVFAGTSRTEGMYAGNTDVSCQLEIHFSRTEDVPMIMQAVHYFFRNMQTTQHQPRINIEFPNAAIPAWARLLHNAAPDYRKTRSTFSNEEALDQLLSKVGWHFSTWFTVQPADINIQKKTKMPNATWSDVMYVDFEKLDIHHEKSPVVTTANPAINPYTP